MNIESALKQLQQIMPSEQLLINESMKKHTSFRIGGPADLLIIPADTGQVMAVLDVLKAYGVPFMVMGNGSNLLVRDKGIRGAVIKIADRFSKAEVNGETITAQSGILLSVLSKLALDACLTGLEFASGIPGTLGGAVAMNAGAYGGEMKDVVKWVNVLDPQGRIVRLNKEDLALGYRTSSIQGSGSIVLDVFMELKKGCYEESKSLIADLARRRREKQPLNYPSAGSVFKRPVGYYAGKLIQDAGLTGARIGDAQVSELHSGFIINLGNATAEDVTSLIELIRQRVMEKYGVELQPEVKIVGEG